MEGAGSRASPVLLLQDLRNSQNPRGCLIQGSSPDDQCHFMGLHRSQKRVISSAGSFPFLNNGALILGFPGLSSVDFGIEGDCVHTLSLLAHLRHLFPPVCPPLTPCVLDPECQPDAHPSGTQHRHFLLDWGRRQPS